MSCTWLTNPLFVTLSAFEHCVNWLFAAGDYNALAKSTSLITFVRLDNNLIIYRWIFKHDYIYVTLLASA